MTTALRHETEVASRFDAASARFKREVGEADYRLRAVVRGLVGLAQPRILDLGCGKGRFATRLAELGAEIVGLDLSAGMLAEAEGFDRVRGSARRLPFADGSFDAVVAVEALQHVGDVEATVTEARRVLRPGGRFLVVDKNAASLNAQRPWLPALAVKWIDERRGRWIYPAGGPVRERWFWPFRLGRMLTIAFDDVAFEPLLSPEEARWRIFRDVPFVRAMVCWTGRAR